MFGDRVPLLGSQEAEAEALDSRPGLLHQDQENAAHQGRDQQGADDGQPPEDPVAAVDPWGRRRWRGGIRRYFSCCLHGPIRF